jgi:hypothetical protein
MNSKRLKKDEIPIKLTPEQLAMVKEADEAFERGESYSFEEVLEDAKSKVKECLPSQSA